MHGTLAKETFMPEARMRKAEAATARQQVMRSVEPATLNLVALKGAVELQDYSIHLDRGGK